jgi:hypothetical protein
MAQVGSGRSRKTSKSTGVRHLALRQLEPSRTVAPLRLKTIGFPRNLNPRQTGVLPVNKLQMDQNYRMLVDQRRFGFTFNSPLPFPLWYRTFRVGAVNAGLMRQPKAVTRDHSSSEGICEQHTVKPHVQYPWSNTIPERSFSQDWNDIKDKVRDALLTCFMTDMCYCS